MLCTLVLISVLWWWPVKTRICFLFLSAVLSHSKNTSMTTLQLLPLDIIKISKESSLEYVTLIKNYESNTPINLWCEYSWIWKKSAIIFPCNICHIITSVSNKLNSWKKEMNDQLIATNNIKWIDCTRKISLKLLISRNPKLPFIQCLVWFKKKISNQCVWKQQQ